MSIIILEVPGEPRGKGRLRHRVVRSKINPMGFASGYTDAKTRQYEEDLQFRAKLLMKTRKPLTGPLVIEVWVFKGIRQSWSKRKQEQARQGLIRPTGKPDWDNYGKICDAFNKVIWNDDSQIVDGRVLKFFSDSPRLKIIVEEIQCDAD